MDLIKIAETTFPTAQINLMNDTNTCPTIGQTNSQGNKLSKSYLRIFLFTTFIVI